MSRPGDMRFGLAPTLTAATSSLVLVGAACMALAIGWLVAGGRAGLAGAIVVGAPLVVYVLRDPVRGVTVGLLLVLLLPGDQSLGLHQLNVIRLAAFGVVAALFLVLYRSPGRRRFTFVDWSVFGLVTMSLIGWGVEAKPPHSSAFASNYLLPFVFYVAARRFGARVGQKFFVLLLAASSLASLTVLYEAFVAHRPLFADQTSYYWNATGVHLFRPGGVFGSPPTAASVLSMVLLTSLPTLSRARGLQRLTVLACFGLCGLALILTFTRGPLIGLGVGLLAYAFLLGPSMWARYLYGGSILAIVAVFAVLPSLESTTLFQKGVLRQGTLSSREIVWHEIPPVIKSSTSHELFGHGINSLVVGLPWLPGQPPADIARYPQLTLAGPQNQFLRTLIESGVLGLLLLFGWLFGTLATGVRAAYGHVVQRREVAAATAACVSFLFTSFVDDALRQSQTFVVVALLSGLVVTLASTRGEAEDVHERLHA